MEQQERAHDMALGARAHQTKGAEDASALHTVDLTSADRTSLRLGLSAHFRPFAVRCDWDSLGGRESRFRLSGDPPPSLPSSSS